MGDRSGVWHLNHPETSVQGLPQNAEGEKIIWALRDADAAKRAEEARSAAIGVDEYNSNYLAAWWKCVDLSTQERIEFQNESDTRRVFLVLRRVTRKERVRYGGIGNVKKS